MTTDQTTPLYAASSFLTWVAHAAGLDAWLPIILAFHTLAAALDAAIPQPSPGSNWIPARKLMSYLALNFANAANSQQPPLVSWMARIVVSAAQIESQQRSQAGSNGLSAEQRSAPLPPR